MSIKLVSGSILTLLSGIVLLGLSSVANAVTFHAGSSYSGKVDAGGVAWHCTDGHCSGAGTSSSADDDMKTCQALVKVVGPLGSFKTSNGTEWSPSKNPNRMAFCNAAVAQR